MELVSADPAAALTYYSTQGLRLLDPELTAPLTMTMTMSDHTWRRLEPLAKARGTAAGALESGLGREPGQKPPSDPFLVARPF